LATDEWLPLVTDERRDEQRTAHIAAREKGKARLCENTVPLLLKMQDKTNHGAKNRIKWTTRNREKKKYTAEKR